MVTRALAAAITSFALLLAGCWETGDNPPGKPSFANPAIYAIADDDGTVHGWLLGTIHALPDGTDWRSPAISLVAAKADSLLVEVADLDNQADAGKAFAALATTPGLPLLAQRVAPAQQARLRDLARAAGIDEAQQRRTETWAAALILARASTNGDPANGADRALIRDFAGRSISELEGAAAQLAIFDALPGDAQRALLSAVIAASEPGNSEADELRRAWLTGDLAAIAAASRQGMMADPGLRAALLTARNQRWLPLIEAQLEPPARPLIAVGAAHLVGPDGLIALLEKSGWRLVRI